MLYRLHNVSHSYGETGGGLSLNEISFTLDRSETAALIGKTGSGKSTLLKLLVGLLKPVSGKVIFDGKPLPRKGETLRRVRRRVGIVFQFPEKQLFEANVKAEVEFGPRNFGLNNISKRAEEALDIVGLPPDKFAHKSPFELSGGEQRRVALASILTCDPEMLLLDEPTAGLDAAGRELLREIIFKRREEGLGNLIISHDLDFLMELCPRALILQAGKLVFDGGREIFYDESRLREWGLEQPELAAVWRDLQTQGRVPAGEVFSLQDALDRVREFKLRE